MKQDNPDTLNFYCKKTVKSFYENKNIFITGATGFLGKTLLEKLLRSCTKISNIYLLMRSKRGKSVTERLELLLKNPLFNRIKEERGEEILQKVILIDGDISKKNLGLHDSDRIMLIENVNIVFHCAATVSFEEPLKNALNLNLLGTIRIMELCSEIKELNSLVYVSTAFSNCDKSEIHETIYSTEFNPNIANDIGNISDEAIDAITRKALGSHPNTYTLTKAMAEEAVFQRFFHFPIAIVRPAIITGAWKEPYPGWLSGLMGVTALFVGCSCGTLKTCCFQGKNRFEIIPVDIVVNTIITSAWYTSTYKPKELQIFNCTSSTMNPVSLKDFTNLMMHNAKIFPPKYQIWYPNMTFISNIFAFYLFEFFISTIPASIYDLFFILTNKQPIMLKGHRKLHELSFAVRIFVNRIFKFKATNFLNLVQAVEETEDCSEFLLDIGSKRCGFTWEEYSKIFYFGIRKYILKDDEVTSPELAKYKIKK